MSKRGELAKPVIFGLADGTMSILGVVFYVSGHPALVFPAAVAGGLTAAVSMAAGEWLSRSDTGFWAAGVMGSATLAGSVLPAVPYALVTGLAAPAASVAACLAVALVVGRLREHRRHPYLETVAVLLVVVAAAVACAVALPPTP